MENNQKEIKSFIKKYINIIEKNQTKIQMDVVDGNIFFTVLRYYTNKPINSEQIEKIKQHLEDIFLKDEKKYIGFNDADYVFPIKSIFGLIDEKYNEELKTKILDSFFTFQNTHDFLKHDKTSDFFMSYKKPEEHKTLIETYSKKIKNDNVLFFSKDKYRYINLFHEFERYLFNNLSRASTEIKTKKFEKLLEILKNNYVAYKDDKNFQHDIDSRSYYNLMQSIIKNSNKETHQKFYQYFSPKQTTTIKNDIINHDINHYDAVISFKKEDLLNKYPCFFNTDILSNFLSNFIKGMESDNNKKINNILKAEKILNNDNYYLFFESDRPIDKKIIKKCLKKVLEYYENNINFDTFRDQKDFIEDNVNHIILSTNIEQTMKQKDIVKQKLKI